MYWMLSENGVGILIEIVAERGCSVEVTFELNKFSVMRRSSHDIIWRKGSVSGRRSKRSQEWDRMSFTWSGDRNCEEGGKWTETMSTCSDSCLIFKIGKGITEYRPFMIFQQCKFFYNTTSQQNSWLTSSFKSLRSFSGHLLISLFVRNEMLAFIDVVCPFLVGSLVVEKECCLAS